MTTAEARAMLHTRYAQQVIRYHRLARIPERVYVQRNLRAARLLTLEQGKSLTSGH